MTLANQLTTFGWTSDKIERSDDRDGANDWLSFLRVNGASSIGYSLWSVRDIIELLK